MQGKRPKLIRRRQQLKTEVRLAALQTIASKSKRKNDDGKEKVAKPKVRRSTAAAVDYLTEKSKKERELRKEELQLKKR